MSYEFRPAKDFTDRHGLFVALVGGPNSGKSYSGLRLARGIAGPDGKIAAVDAEGGRLLHLKRHFDFDIMMMDPPHRPERYAEAARAAEEQGYAALLIDSFTMEWRGVGGVLDWIDQIAEQMSGGDTRKRDRIIHTARIRPKTSHKLMVFSLLQRRIPIIFSIRGEDTFDPTTNQKAFKIQFEKGFPFEVTVSFRLASDKKGIIDLSDPKSWKMEGAHRAIFRDGEQLSEKHGAALAAWARGGAPTTKEPGNAPTNTPEAPEGSPSVHSEDRPAAGATQGGGKKIADVMDELLVGIRSCETAAALVAFAGQHQERIDWLKANRPALYKEIDEAIQYRGEQIDRGAVDGTAGAVAGSGAGADAGVAFGEAVK